MQYESSYPQQSIWLFEQIAPGTAAYVDSRLLLLHGPLDVEALGHALDDLVARREALRTSTHASPSGSVQIVAERGSGDFLAHDLRALPPHAREDAARRLVNETAARPMDIERGPLIRVLVATLEDERHYFLLCLQHIAIDAVSQHLLLGDLGAFYEARVTGKHATLAPLTTRYADFAALQREQQRSGATREALEYWKRVWSSVPPPPNLPYDRPHPRRRTFAGDVVRRWLDVDMTHALDTLRREEKTGTLALVVSGLGALLARYGSDEIAIGAIVGGRTRPEFGSIVGMFVNSIALRMRASGTETFRDLLRRARVVVSEGLAHSDLPIDELIAAVRPSRAEGHEPLYRIIANYYDLGPLRLAGAGIFGEGAEMIVRATPFDIALHVTRVERGLLLQFEFSSELFERETVARMLDHLYRILESATRAPDVPISRIELLAPDELDRMLAGWNDTIVAYPREATIAALFAEQVVRSPEAVALVCGEERLTYRDLAARAARLARDLASEGVGPEVRIGICLDRSVDQVVAILATLQAGGAYVPLAPEYPTPRLRQMIEDAAIAAVVTDPSHESRLPLEVKRIYPTATGAPGRALEPRGYADGLAYVMYTSGSTGRPKGVAITNRAVVRLVRGANFASFGPDDIFLQLAPMGFDASTLEVWAALLNGATLVLAPPGPLGPDEIGDLVERARVTTLWLTAGLFHQIVDSAPDKLRDVRQLLAGGDVLSPSHVAKALGALASGAVINGYGPTENTTFTCCHAMRRASDLGTGSVPIGRPVSNTRVYVLDDELRPVPVGIAGNLYAAGDGLARGYVGDAALTADRFVPDPFAPGGGERMYRTGDSARYRPDGVIEFLGRRDMQVKVRGHRVELGEIEAALLEHARVGEAVVTAREDRSGDKRLVAYVVSSGERPEASELRAHLEARIPSFMTPSSFVCLDALPLTENGKVDRRALPEPHAERAGADPPRDETERLIAAIWSEVLGVEQIGRTENFFELGGHSLLAGRIASRARSALGVDVTVRSLFEHPTVADLSTFTRTLVAAPRAVPTIRRVRKPGSGSD